MTPRVASISDASSIAALSIEVWLATYPRRGISASFADHVLTEFTKPKTEAHFSDPDECILVSDNDEGIDGFIRLSFGGAAPVEGCAETEISTFYVQPRHQGKGVGKKLLRAAIQQCRDRGFQSVWLATNAENTPAIAFYLARGFEQVGHTHFRLKDQAYLNNVYSYRLT